MSDRRRVAILVEAVRAIAKRLMTRGGIENQEFIDIVETEMDARGYGSPANHKVAWRFFLEQVTPSRRANRLLDDDAAQFVLDLINDIEEIEQVRYKDLSSKNIKLGDFGVDEIDAKDRQIRKNNTTITHARLKWERLVIGLVRPLLVANEGWVYRDAIEHLRRTGALPPDLEDE